MKNLAKWWNKDHLRIPGNRSVSSFAKDKEKLFPRNATVCDLGGGTGTDAIFFLRKRHTVILVDISDYALEISKKKASKLGFTMSTKQADLGKGVIPLPNNSVNVVYSRMALQYFTTRQMVSIFKEVLRILKKKGEAFISLKSSYANNGITDSNATEVESGVFKVGNQVKNRFSDSMLKKILNMAKVGKFKIYPYQEDFSGKTDKVKFKSKIILLNEVYIIK